LATHKYKGLSTYLKFLGIEIDSKLRLPADKLERVQKTVQEWLEKDSSHKRDRDLESMVGLLQHAASVVRPGHHFVRRIIEEMVKVKKRNHHVCLNEETKSDLLWWWYIFLERWNGVGQLRE